MSATKPRTKQKQWQDHEKQLKRLTRRGHRPYAPNWHGSNGFCHRIRSLTRNRCINCLGKATLVHHYYYRKGLRMVKIYGIEGYNDGAPLCDRCHGLVHSKEAWIVDPKDPDNDRNTPEVIGQLRLQFWVLVAICQGWWVAVFLAIALWLGVYSIWFLAKKSTVEPFSPASEAEVLRR